MESFDFIHLSDSEENRKYLKVGFNNISNLAFESVGLAVTFGYLFQCITTKENRYGLQLFRSFPALQNGRFKGLKEKVLGFCRGYDISKLEELYCLEVVEELKVLASEIFPDESFSRISRSLRNFSEMVNSRIIIFYQDQVIEINKSTLPGPVLVCITFEELSKVNLLYSDKDPIIESFNKPEEILLQIIRQSLNQIKELANFPVFFEDLRKYLKVLPDDLQEEIQEILKRTPNIILRPPPILKELKNERNFDSNCKNEKSIPLTVKETLEFMNEFEGKYRNNFKKIKKNKKKFDFWKKYKPLGFSQDDYLSQNSLPGINVPGVGLNSLMPPFSPPSLPLPPHPPPSPFLFSSHRCKGCKETPVLIPGNPHPCQLCVQCYYETILTKECIRCKYKYQDSEIEMLKVFIIDS